MTTADRVRQLFDYDPETGIFTRRRRVTNAKHKAECSRADGYVSIHFDGKNHKAHRMAWLYVYGELPAAYIDHINGNRSDNRIANLREATVRQNAQNIGGPYRNNKRSGVLGVYPHDHGKWHARIQLDHKSRSLGLYATKEEASAAYLRAKAQLHPFAKRV